MARRSLTAYARGPVVKLASARATYACGPTRTRWLAAMAGGDGWRRWLAAMAGGDAPGRGWWELLPPPAPVFRAARALGAAAPQRPDTPGIALRSSRQRL